MIEEYEANYEASRCNGGAALIYSQRVRAAAELFIRRAKRRRTLNHEYNPNPAAIRLVRLVDYRKEQKNG